LGAYLSKGVEAEKSACKSSSKASDTLSARVRRWGSTSDNLSSGGSHRIAGVFAKGLNLEPKEGTHTNRREITLSSGRALLPALKELLVPDHGGDRVSEIEGNKAKEGLRWETGEGRSSFSSEEL